MQDQHGLTRRIADQIMMKFSQTFWTTLFARLSGFEFGFDAGVFRHDGRDRQHADDLLIAHQQTFDIVAGGGTARSPARPGASPRSQ